MTGRITKGNGGKRHQKIEEPKIVGGQKMKAPGETKVIDQRTRARPVQIDYKEHGEVVSVQSHTRAKPRKKSDPEIRLRSMTDEQKKEWEAVKRGDWED